MVTEIMDAYRFVPFLHPVTPTPWFSSLQLDFQHIFRQKTSTWRNDGGGGGGDGVPTTLAHCSSPSLNARREKISRAGKPLTLIRQIIDFSRLESSHSWIFTHFLDFSPLNLLSCRKQGIRVPGRGPAAHASARPCVYATGRPASHSVWNPESSHLWDIHFFTGISI